MRRRNARRRLSLTSLIDVIFLLLLFFMLSSTFTRFAEVELSAAGSGAAVSAQKPIFLSLAPDTLRLNGEAVALDSLADTLAARGTDDTPITVLVALQGEVSAQRLTDLLVAVRGLPNLRLTVLEAA